MSKNKDIDFDKLKPYPCKKSGWDLVPAYISSVTINKKIYDELLGKLQNTNVLTDGERGYTVLETVSAGRTRRSLLVLDLKKLEALK